LNENLDHWLVFLYMKLIKIMSHPKIHFIQNLLN